MNFTKVIDFEVLNLVNKFKMYCYLDYCSCDVFFFYVRYLNKTGITCNTSMLYNVKKYYNTFIYKKEWVRDLLLTTLNKLLDLIADDSTNSRLIINCFNYKAKKQRLTNKILDIINDSNYQYKYFGTLTFNNDSVNLKADTRHDYIRKYLKNLDNKHVRYIANVDFGKKNKRVHYHCIIATNLSIDDLQDSYKYGYSNFKEIDLNDDTCVKLSSYINKLVNHTYKDGTLSENVIFSRKARVL